MYFNSFEESLHFCHLVYIPKIKFHKKLPNSSQGVTCGWTDVTKQGNFLQICLKMVNISKLMTHAP